MEPWDPGRPGLTLPPGLGGSLLKDAVALARAAPRPCAPSLEEVDGARTAGDTKAYNRQVSK